MLMLFILMFAMQPQAFINEFPHPPLVVHFHPNTGQFKLDDLRFALDHKVHAVELDLHFRDGIVVCNHDSATSESPTLRQALDMIFRRKVRDGLQFFIVLEPKENSGALFDAILKVLGDYQARLSMSSKRLSKPRDVTVVITGAYPAEFYSHFAPGAVNRLCIVERGMTIQGRSPTCPATSSTGFRSGTRRGQARMPPESALCTREPILRFPASSMSASGTAMPTLPKPSPSAQIPSTATWTSWSPSSGCLSIRHTDHTVHCLLFTVRLIPAARPGARSRAEPACRSARSESGSGTPGRRSRRSQRLIPRSGSASWRGSPATSRGG